VTAALDERLLRLKSELDDHSRVARYLGLDFERPIRSLADGYPENAIALVGSITERLLKQLWLHHGAPGTPMGKALSDLISGCRSYIRSHRVLDALHEIQRLRNRAVHDGYPVAEEDGLIAVRRLLDVLAWYTSTGSGALSQQAPKVSPATAARAEFLAGLYVTLDFRLVKRAELSQHALYQLFVRERGLRTEHVELLLARDTAEAARVLAATGGRLLRTGLTRLTRFLAVEVDGGDRPAQLPADCQVVSYDRFMDAFVDLDRHLVDVAQLYPRLDAPAVPIEGDVLSVDEQSGEMEVSSAGDARELLRRLADSGGNLLIVGRPGSGKTTLLKQLVAAPEPSAARRYRFYFDLSLKDRAESFADFAARTLAPYMHVEAAYVFPLFCYFTRSGSVLCALDGFDEAVHETTLAGLLGVFTEVAQVLSAESAVVMTSRVSFLEDSPQVRRLLDGTSLLSERLAQQLHAQGVDPQRVPRFSVLRLRDDVTGGSLLADQLRRRAAAARDEGGQGQRPPISADSLADLLWWHITQVAEPSLLPRMVEYFGLAFLRGVTVFPLVELVNELGIGIFISGRVEWGTFRLQELFRAADTAGEALALRHTAYQELLAADFLRSPDGRDAALAAIPHPRLTEEVREFLYRRSTAASLPGPAGGTGDCVVPAGVYLVGPSHHLILRRMDRPVRLDRYPVTVSRYKRFLDAIRRDGAARWDHPGTPAEHSHQPDTGRLPIPSYYEDPAYDNHPAVAVDWWSAYAFASFEGKRLPTSLEWEAAARGFDGRLFPWGDDVDMSVVNCADSWSDHPLITYAAWREEHDRGRLAKAFPGPVDAHPGNTSPFGVKELGGNVWEWTSTVLDSLDEAVVCGGSYDNPYRAVQASSKDTYGRREVSSVVGFRCAQEVR
jgi:energy-coupling factor transporter ATP-binding protein EcfA2